MRASDKMGDAVGKVTRGGGTKLERHFEQDRLNVCMKVGIGTGWCDRPCPRFQSHIWRNL